VHLAGGGAAQGVLRQGHRRLAHRLPAVWFRLAGGVRRGPGDAQQPEAHRGREGQDGGQGEGRREKPRGQEQRGQRDGGDAASCQHLASQCVCVCVFVCVCVCLPPFKDFKSYGTPEYADSKLILLKSSKSTLAVVNPLRVKGQSSLNYFLFEYTNIVHE